MDLSPVPDSYLAVAVGAIACVAAIVFFRCMQSKQKKNDAPALFERW